MIRLNNRLLFPLILYTVIQINVIFIALFLEFSFQALVMFLLVSLAQFLLVSLALVLVLPTLEVLLKIMEVLFMVLELKHQSLISLP